MVEVAYPSGNPKLLHMSKGEIPVYVHFIKDLFPVSDQLTKLAFVHKGSEVAVVFCWNGGKRIAVKRILRNHNQ